MVFSRKFIKWENAIDANSLSHRFVSVSDGFRVGQRDGRCCPQPNKPSSHLGRPAQPKPVMQMTSGSDFTNSDAQLLESCVCCKGLLFQGLVVAGLASILTEPVD